MRQRVGEGEHRSVIGGLWEELGLLQRNFLIAQGLRPQHAFLDVGAGSFRAGVKLVPFLDAGNYYAIDSNAPLLEAGYTQEIEPAGLASRFPRQNFAATRDFDPSGFTRQFDAGIAQSVFTHMPLIRLRHCLDALAPSFRTGGWFFATVFLVAEHQADQAVRHDRGGITTQPSADPYHTTTHELGRLADTLPAWRLSVIGDWNHPRDQQMLLFERQ